MCESKIQLIKDRVSIENIVKLYDNSIDINNKGMCRCIIHKDTNPSFKINYDTNTFFCFGCGKKGDVIDLIQYMEKIDNKLAMDFIINKFRLNIESINNNKDFNRNLNTKKIVIEKKKHFKNPEIVNEMQSFIANIGMTNYFQKRGLLLSTIKRFKLGYDKVHKMAVVPYNKELTYYQSRSTFGKHFFKVQTERCGAEPIFNEKVLGMKDIIFVVESPICAMSVAQCGGNAIALCGVPNYHKVLGYLKEHRATFGGKLIICLDNDNGGQTGTIEFAKELLQMGIAYFVENIADECKDPNDLLMKDWHRLKNNVQNVIKKIGDLK